MMSGTYLKLFEQKKKIKREIYKVHVENVHIAEIG